MAKIIELNGASMINVSDSVGRGGVNAKGDVLVVQALLKYAVELVFYTDVFSEPTGKMDRNTENLIIKYQKFKQQFHKSNVSTDGRVSPLRDGMFVPGKSLEWTIRLLNEDAYLNHITYNLGGNYIESLNRRFPQIGKVLGPIPVGDLSLTLESSPVRVGTLNLGLE